MVISYGYAEDSPMLSSPLRMQLGYFHVTAEPVLLVQLILALL